MGFGPFIKAARKRAGLTQEQLAEKCGLATITIRQYERGVREPRYEQLKSIASALEIEVTDLVSDSQIISVALDMAANAVKSEPLKKASDSELEKLGILQFNSEEDRIAYFYSKLNIDGKLMACRCFYQNLNPDALKNVADYVQRLSDTPQYQRTDELDKEIPEDSD